MVYLIWIFIQYVVSDFSEGQEMKKFFYNLISKLYFKYCFKHTKLAEQIVLYYIPGKFQKPDSASVIIAQINKGILAEKEPLRLVGFGTFPDFEQVSEIEYLKDDVIPATFKERKE